MACRMLCAHLPTRSSKAAHKQNLADAFKATGIPLLAIHGKDDHIIPASHTDAVKGFAKVELFADTGHMSQMEKSKEANALIAAHAK